MSILTYNWLVSVTVPRVVSLLYTYKHKYLILNLSIQTNNLSFNLLSKDFNCASLDKDIVKQQRI